VLIAVEDDVLDAVDELAVLDVVDELSVLDAVEEIDVDVKMEDVELVSSTTLLEIELEVEGCDSGTQRISRGSQPRFLISVLNAFERETKLKMAVEKEHNERRKTISIEKRECHRPERRTETTT
jgi:hypothetical protein